MDFVVYVTAFIVSADAMAAGFALAMHGTLTPRTVCTIGAITLMLCMPAAVCGTNLAPLFGDGIAYVGGLILCLVGARNLSLALISPVQRSDRLSPRNTDAIAVGFAVGLDAAVANLSLSIMGNDSLLVPCLFAAMHIIAVGIGYISLTLLHRTHILDCTSAAILFGIGMYKIFCFFGIV